MPKFRVLQGQHCEGERTEDGKLVKYKRGDVFESKSDLDKKFNSPVSIKFERLPDSAVVTNSPVAKAAAEGFATLTNESKPADPTFSIKELEGMTEADLRKLASEEEIDLGNLKKKDDIIKQIHKCLTSAVPA